MGSYSAKVEQLCRRVWTAGLHPKQESCSINETSGLKIHVCMWLWDLKVLYSIPWRVL